MDSNFVSALSFFSLCSPTFQPSFYLSWLEYGDVVVGYRSLRVTHSGQGCGLRTQPKSYAKMASLRRSISDELAGMGKMVKDDADTLQKIIRSCKP